MNWDVSGSLWMALLPSIWSEFSGSSEKLWAEIPNSAHFLDAHWRKIVLPYLWFVRKFQGSQLPTVHCSPSVLNGKFQE